MSSMQKWIFIVFFLNKWYLCLCILWCDVDIGDVTMATSVRLSAALWKKLSSVQLLPRTGSSDKQNSLSSVTVHVTIWYRFLVIHDDSIGVGALVWLTWVWASVWPSRAPPSASLQTRTYAASTPRVLPASRSRRLTMSLSTIILKEQSPHCPS